MLLSFPSSSLDAIKSASIFGRVHIELNSNQRLDFASPHSQQLLRAAPNGCVLSSFPINSVEESSAVEQAVIGWLNSSAEVVVLEGAPELVVAVAERLPRSRVFYRVPSETSLTDVAALLSSTTLSQALGGFEISIPTQGTLEAFIHTCQNLRTAAKTDSDKNHGYGHGYETTLVVVPSKEDLPVLPSTTIGQLDKMGVSLLLTKSIGLCAPATATTTTTTTTSSSSSSFTFSSTSSSTSSSTKTTVSNIGPSFISCLRTDRPDGLFSTVVCDECGVALGLVYSSTASICESIQTGRGVYYSRSRKGLWRKGETSGAIQELVLISFDCDSDALRFCVRQRGDPPSFCHTGNRSCWGPAKGLRALQQVLQSRLASAPEGSYTRRLYNDEALLRNKLLEEAQELSEAKETDHVAAEAADVVYFTMVAAVKGGASLEQIEAHLDRRTLKIKRRPGNAKPERIAAAAAQLQAIQSVKRRKLNK